MPPRLGVVLLVVASVGCSATGDGGRTTETAAASTGSAELALGDETHEFVVLERCILADDGRVLVKGVGTLGDDALRLAVARAASPVVDDELVDEITVTKDDAPWVTQATPVTTTKPAPLWTVDGLELAGDGIEFRRADQPGATVTGSIEVTCP